jgi:hypothetical protein
LLEESSIRPRSEEKKNSYYLTISFKEYCFIRSSYSNTYCNKENNSHNWPNKISKSLLYFGGQFFCKICSGHSVTKQVKLKKKFIGSFFCMTNKILIALPK